MLTAMNFSSCGNKILEFLYSIPTTHAIHPVQICVLNACFAVGIVLAAEDTVLDKEDTVLVWFGRISGQWRESASG